MAQSIEREHLGEDFNTSADVFINFYTLSSFLPSDINKLVVFFLDMCARLGIRFNGVGETRQLYYEIKFTR